MSINNGFAVLFLIDICLIIATAMISLIIGRLQAASFARDASHAQRLSSIETRGIASQGWRFILAARPDLAGRRSSNSRVLIDPRVDRATAAGTVEYPLNAARALRARARATAKGGSFRDFRIADLPMSRWGILAGRKLPAWMDDY